MRPPREEQQGLNDDMLGGASQDEGPSFEEQIQAERDLEADAFMAEPVGDTRDSKDAMGVKREEHEAGACPSAGNDPVEVAESQHGREVCKDELGDELGEECVDGETIAKIKRRRLLKGAFASATDFRDLFQGYRDIVASELATVERDSSISEHATLERSKMLWASVRDSKPTWSEEMVRLGAALIAVCNMRLSDRMFVGDSAFLLWMIEGNSTIRVHSGFCYIYNDDGAFLPYSGTPPEAILSRVSSFCAILEGSLKRLPKFLSPG